MNIRDYFNSFKNADFVEAIRNVPLTYGYINSLNLFDTRATNQLAVVFDVDSVTNTLLPQVQRGAKSATQGKDRGADTHALKLAYFKHADRLTGDDIQSWRQVGSTDNETIARATAQKMEDMRRKWDETKEYLQLQAMKGILKTPDGTVMHNMFTEFGVTQTEVDFDLGDATTDIDAKIFALKQAISKNVKTGGAIGGVKVFVDPEFYSKLIKHDNFREVYLNYVNRGPRQMLADDNSIYSQWGVMEEVTHRGVSFVMYDATFNLPDGTTEDAFEASTGLAIPVGQRGLFRGFYGPSNKMSEANQPGQEIFMRNYVDPQDEFVEFEMESAPLYFATKPSALVSVVSST